MERLGFTCIDLCPHSWHNGLMAMANGHSVDPGLGVTLAENVAEKYPDTEGHYAVTVEQ